MNRSRRTLAALLVLAFAVSCPLAAHAQFGSLKDRLKKKATEVVTGKPAPQAAAEGEQAEAPDTNVVVIGADALARFEAGLKAEAARRTEVEAKLHVLRSPGNYDNCQMEWAMSDEGRKVNDEVRAAASDARKVEAAIQKRNDAVEAHCGHDPGDYEFKRKLQASIPLAGVEPSGFSGRQYAILRERVLIYLGKDKKLWHLRGDRKGGGLYVFSPDEVSALDARADALHELLKEQL